MLKIYLCEDEKAQLERWEEIITKYLVMHEVNMELYCSTAKPAQVLECLKRSDSPGLYFLDIDLKAEMNGFQLAGEIRKYDPRGYLVFITTHGEMAPLTFKLKVEAMDFILKDEPGCLKERIISCIEAAASNYYKYLETKNRAMVVKEEFSFVKMDQEDILFITTDLESRTIAIHTCNGVRRRAGTLKEIAVQLNPWFYYCSRSTIVNIKNAAEYLPDVRKIRMKNGALCDVSFRKAGEIKQRLKEWR